MRKNRVSADRVKTSDILAPEKIAKLNIFGKSIDWLSITLVEPLVFFRKVSHILDTDNSNSYYDSFYNFTVQKYNTRQGVTLAIYREYLSFPVMLASITCYSSGLVNASNAWGNLQLTSTFFRIAFLERNVSISSFDYQLFVSDPLFAFLSSFQTSGDVIYKLGPLFCGSLSRLDYALDFEFTPCELGLVPPASHVIKPRSNSKTLEYKEGFSVNAWVFGSRSSKNMYFRCYDKNLDTSKKGKSFLFPEYEDKHIARFEVEHLYHSISRFTLRDIDKAMNYCDSLVGLKDRSFSYKVDRALIEKIYRKQAVYHGSKFIKASINSGENPFLMLSDIMQKELLHDEYKSYFNSFFS